MAGAWSQSRWRFAAGACLATDLSALRLKLGQHTSEDGLDPVPRALSRQGREWPRFYGWDLWNAYEVSFLLPSLKPVVYHLQVSYPADSPMIVESKSFKLFLNARNGRVFADLEAFAAELRQELSACVGAAVELVFHPAETGPARIALDAALLDELEPSAHAAAYAPTLLRRLPSAASFSFKSHLLRSNCPVTNQPDWGTVWLRGRGAFAPDPAALLAYLISFRNHQDFHEACCEAIFADLHQLLEPTELTVSCHYTRRGGLDINPVRSTDPGIRPITAMVWRQ